MLIQTAQGTFNANGVFATMTILAVVALLSELFITALENRLITLKWIQTHTAQEIADKMPPDYYAGDKALYVTALQNQLAMYSPDRKMPSDGPQSVLSTEQQTNTTLQGKQIDLNATFTDEFASKAS